MGSRKAMRRGHPRPRGRIVVGPESLEERRVLSAAPVAEDAAHVHPHGLEAGVVTDSYVLRMPQTNAATSQGLWDYASATPTVQAGWSIRSLGMGYFEIEAPGASAADVLSWSTQVGVATISQNSLLTKQAVERKLPNDPRILKGQQWGLDNLGQPKGESVDPNVPYKADADIDAPEAWRIDPVNQNTGSRNIVVAILDDGIDYTHPDLQANMWQRPASVPEKITGDTNWYMGRFGFDVGNRDEDQAARNIYSTMPLNPNDAHGTAVAGIIGAKGNDNRGITGVNWDVSMLTAKIFRDGGTYSSNADFVEAVNRIIRLRTQFGVNIAVVNASWMSIRASDAPPPFGDGVMAGAVEALAQAGILFVTAVGNGYDANGDFVGDLADGDMHLFTDPCPTVWPANYYGFNPVRYGNVIGVAASTPSDTLARFSNFGSSAHIAAPGENIWTTVPLKARDLGSADYRSRESIQSDPRLPFRQFEPWSQTPAGVNGGYAQMSGTSMSAAYVSGVAALAAAEYMRWTSVLPGVGYLRRAVVDQAEAVSTLTYTETTTPKPGLDGVTRPDPMAHTSHSIGGGRLNAYNTVKWVRENLPPKVTFATAGVLEGDAGTTDVTVRVVLTRAVTADLTIQYWTEPYVNEATSGVDYVAISSSTPRSLTIPAGQTALTVTLPAIVRGDTTPEPNERFWVKFRMPPNAEAWLASKALAVTIINDDSSPSAPAATLDPAPIVVKEGNGGSAQPKIVNVPVTLDLAPTRTILVPYEVTSVAAAGATLPAGSVAATPGVDYAALSGTLSFAAGQRSAVIPVRIFDDKVVAGRPGEAQLESFAVRILQPNPGVLKAGRSVKVVTIDDDDTAAPVPPGPPTAPVIDAFDASVVRGGVASIPVNLSSPVPAGWTLSILYRTVGGGDAVAGADYQAIASGRVAVAAGQSSAAINVQTFNNKFATYSRKFFVEITGAVLTKVGSTNPADSINVLFSKRITVEIL